MGGGSYASRGIHSHLRVCKVGVLRVPTLMALSGPPRVGAVLCALMAPPDLGTMSPVPTGAFQHPCIIPFFPSPCCLLGLLLCLAHASRYASQFKSRVSPPSNPLGLATTALSCQYRGYWTRGMKPVPHFLRGDAQKPFPALLHMEHHQGLVNPPP